MDEPILASEAQARAPGRDLYEAVGGAVGCRALSADFYAHVAREPLLRPLFPGKSFTCAIEAFAAFLVQFLGGPPEAAQRRHGLSLRESHRRFAIGLREREAWLRQMDKALDEVRIEEPVRHALRGFFAQSSSYLVNQGPATSSDESLGEPLHDDIDREFNRRWAVQRELDKAVAAVRDRDAARAITLARGSLLQTYFQQDRAVWATLLALMIDSGHDALLDYVEATLTADPALVQERYGGRMLVHEASAVGSVRAAALLLRLGADPNAEDLGGHAPLYWVANARTGNAGEQIARLLIAAGATINAATGVTRCTALHMAARRGNVAVAAALLDAGADIEARDRRGDTPLRRAVNCEQSEVADLLLKRGADRQPPAVGALRSRQRAPV